MNLLDVLIGCEESQVMTSAFRGAGHNAFSCDIQHTRGFQDWHYRCDVMDAIAMRRWDLIILHPDCTAMANSGNRWYGRGMPRHSKRLDDVVWTKNLWMHAKAYANHVALENPVGVLFKHLPNVHYVQPYQFGHGETKKTGFALHNLPPLVPTKIVEGRDPRVWKMAPGPNRKRDRSETYEGIARACASQWGMYILKEKLCPQSAC